MLELFYQPNAQTSVLLPHRSYQFPGGEEGVLIDMAYFNAVRSPTDTTDSSQSTAAQERYIIKAQLRTSADVMELFMLTDALRQTVPDAQLHLDMPYVPYARQDRVCRLGEAFSAGVFCSLINSQNYASVRILDPHSAITPELLARAIVDSALDYVRRAVHALDGDVVLVAPDAGAAGRVREIATTLALPMLQAHKTRDPITGTVTGVEIDVGAITAGTTKQTLLVVDDICDGGRTFVELARAVNNKSPQHPMALYVSHGIFSKGLEVLTPFYSYIFCVNSWLDTDTPSLSLV